MRALLLIAMLALTVCEQQTASAAAPVLDKQALHAKGQCGTMKPGTGLTRWPDGTVRGEVTSMLPGLTAFRMRGAGTVTLTLDRVTNAYFDAQAFKTVVIEGAAADSVLEWKPAIARNWTAVPTAFLYPRPITQAQLDVDAAMKYDLPVAGVNLKPSQLRDPRLLAPAGAWKTAGSPVPVKPTPEDAGL